MEDERNDAGSGEEKCKAPGWLRPALALLVIVILIVVGKAVDAPARLRDALEWVQQLGWIGVGVYVSLYIVACVLFLPGLILTLGAGFIFGVVKGSIVVSIASTLGATAAFLVGRYLARDWVSGKVLNRPKFKAIDEAIGREGWRIVGLTRLSPVFPFNLLNYAFGLTRVPLGQYVPASWIGMMPGTIMYVYLGSVAGSLATLGGERESKTTAEWIFYGVGLLATVAVTVYVTHVARRALNQKIDTSEEPS